jgi:hypothetical protein
MFRCDSALMPSAWSERPLCPGCGRPVGTYEPLWRFAPDVGAERTSWLNLGVRDATLESLWHTGCAEDVGVDGG